MAGHIRLFGNERDELLSTRVGVRRYDRLPSSIMESSGEEEEESGCVGSDEEEALSTSKPCDEEPPVMVKISEEEAIAGRGYFSALPKELWLKIMSILMQRDNSLKSLGQLARTSKLMHHDVYQLETTYAIPKAPTQPLLYCQYSAYQANHSVLLSALEKASPASAREVPRIIAKFVGHSAASGGGGGAECGLASIGCLAGSGISVGCFVAGLKAAECFGMTVTGYGAVVTGTITCCLGGATAASILAISCCAYRDRFFSKKCNYESVKEDIDRQSKPQAIEMRA